MMVTVLAMTTVVAVNLAAVDCWMNSRMPKEETVPEDDDEKEMDAMVRRALVYANFDAA